MFAVKKSFELGICPVGYTLGQRVGGWGGGIVLAFAGLLATSYGWDQLERKAIAPKVANTPTLNFVYGAAATLIVLAVAFLNWGRTY